MDQPTNHPTNLDGASSQDAAAAFRWLETAPQRAEAAGQTLAEFLGTPDTDRTTVLARPSGPGWNGVYLAIADPDAQDREYPTVRLKQPGGGRRTYALPASFMRCPHCGQVTVEWLCVCPEDQACDRCGANLHPSRSAR